ncbi:tyrosine-type recombinase/integrase [Pseudonocardia alni]|uniref:tyrosine-type recombinase/integrase n=1 Tax=Pseudonocardia alni TaxID=33907 RepID=UPI0033F5F5B7
MIDDQWDPVEAVDRYLRHLRLGRDRAESTTKAYAGSLALFLRWCGRTGRDWRFAAGEVSSFMLWLRYTPVGSSGGEVARPGPGAAAVRGERRINGVLIAVRGFYLFAVRAGEVDRDVVGQLYEVADARDLPGAARGEDSQLTVRLAALHRMREPVRAVERLSDAEVVAMLGAARCARDQLLLLLMARAGLRRGEVVGLRRGDLHLLVDNASLGCRVGGSHVHVVQRENSNGARAKSRRPRQVPVDGLVVAAADLYAAERGSCLAAASSDFLLVNLWRAPVGAPMRLGAVNELMTRLARSAGLDRAVSPHMARHAFASNVIDAGGSVDEVQRLLGHADPSSSQVYIHPDRDRLRAAVTRVPALSGRIELVRR